MNSSAPRRIAVCADDFGLDAAASEAILELMAGERLLSTSVLVFGAAIPAFSARLCKQLKPHHSLGLHFTLTEATPDGSRATVGGLALRSHLYVLSTIRVAESLERQLDKFEDLFDAAPAYVDGHEHVHQFPGVRSVLIDAVLRRYGTSVAIRCTHPRYSRGLKARVISMLGGRRLQSNANKQGIIVNKDFAGVYDFTPGDYRARVQHWLASLADDGLLMCHPAKSADEAPMSRARHQEYLYFNSPQWLEDLAAHAVELRAFF